MVCGRGGGGIDRYYDDRGKLGGCGILGEHSESDFVWDKVDESGGRGS